MLAEEGVSFTILAPRQAVSIGGRPVDEATLDPSTPYRWEGQRGASVTVLFYDGGLSNDVAFGIGAMTSEVLIDRVVNRNKPLVVIATDGETFGHHHHFADRTLAYALTAEASQRGVRVATAAEIVGEMPASETVAVRPSAWSCAHGVERWRSDCGCSTGGGPGWHQRWRAPLRAALDLFRDAAAAVFERRGAALFAGGDPWAVRDRYVEVVIGEREWSDFESEHVTQEHAVARTLLEAQRSAMAMYTSCGWFFNDIAGIEAQIVLRHASSLADRLATIDEALPIEQFVSILATAIGNQRLNGADVWAEIRTAGRAARRIPAGQSAHMAPIVSSFDSAQERVLSALQRRAALDDDDLGVIATALAISPDVMAPDVMAPDVMAPDQQ